MTNATQVAMSARSRIAQQRPQIMHALRVAQMGVPLAAETDAGRLRDRIRAKAGISSEAAAVMARGLTLQPLKGGDPAAEAIQGTTIDFVGVSFFLSGFQSSQAVARVAFKDGKPCGSGFMVSPSLFLTNNHVIGTPAAAANLVAEFEYELDPMGRPRKVTRFEFDPGAFFVTNQRDDLDFTLIALGSKTAGDRPLTSFGCCPLSSAKDKHALGEIANIIQHPDGRYKEAVLRENRLVSRLETVLHYVADTEPGSSGSPVFNNEWKVIALHHWGGPWRAKVDDQGKPVPREVNEGIRASAIVAALQDRAATLKPEWRRSLQEFLEIGERASDPVVFSHAARDPNILSSAFGPRLDSSGSVVWRVPVEISVRIPGMEGSIPASPTPLQNPPVSPLPAAGAASSHNAPTPEKVEVDPNYDARSGYQENFIPGFSVPRPKLSTALKKRAARNLQARSGEDPFELRYHHFSVVMDGKRRLALYTACNIDGSTAKNIDRRSGRVTPAVPGADESRGSAEDAEAREEWFSDERLNASEQTDDTLYLDQIVPGARGQRDRMNRMFQRGHLVRRKDPAWGQNTQALKADADTFHFTNCTPQVGFFNMGSAAAGPGTGGGRLWRALEDYVLDNAVVEKAKICVFTGPVLDDRHDPEWRQHVVAGFRVPMKFWKIVVWTEGSRLHALAMLADQKPVIDELPEELGPEEFADTSLVADFLTTVSEIESLTDLNFGTTIRGADIRGGESGAAARTRMVASVEDLPIGAAYRRQSTPTKRARPKSTNKKSPLASRPTRSRRTATDAGSNSSKKKRPR